MPYEICNLPDYPVTEDVWDRLAAETRPIFLYGMGNGADKLFARLERYGVAVAEMLASEGFVRGHSFRGFRVKTLAELRTIYTDFVIVVSFASNREEVINMISDIDKKYTVYIPDMPVAGDEYFDKEFYNSNYGKIKKVYDALGDEDSRNAYASIINYKLTGRLAYLEGAYSDAQEIYGCLGCDGIRLMVDAGAYNGDTVREAREYMPHLSRAIAIEPDSKNFKRLLKYLDSVPEFDAETINAAVWSEDAGAAFISSGNRNSSVSSTPSYQHKDAEVRLISIDCLKIKPDFIKYDVEGAEKEALIGSHGTILDSHPALLVSIYHRSEDIFAIPLQLMERYDFYRMLIRRRRCFPAWEIDLLLIPQNSL